MERKTQIEIITGPAGCGKTARCLAAYRDVLRRSLGTGRPAAVLWIAPSDFARRAVLASLLDDSLPVAFAPNVETFSSLSQRLLADSAIRSLDPAVRRRVLRKLIDSLDHEGRLGQFAGIARTGGFLELVEAFISELKRAEIWPDEFAAVCRKIGNREKDRILGELYARYQQRLLETDVYDEEGKLWSARDVLGRKGPGPLAGRELIVVDGFTDFSRTQQEMIALLGTGSRSLWITLPLETPVERADLFAKSLDARDRLTRSLAALGKIEVVSLEREAASTVFDDLPAMRQVSRELFRNPRDTNVATDGSGITVVAVTGSNAEVDVVAQRVKALLRDGVDPAEIVVAVRSLDAEADLWRSRFAAAGIPYWCSAGFPLLREPVVRSLLEVVRLELEDWPFERLKAVLRANYFRPVWKLRDIPSRIDGLLAFLRARKLHRHQRVMERILKDCKDRYAGEYKLFVRLDRALSALRSNSDFAGWVGRLTALAGELGIAPRTDESEPSAGRADDRDAAAWKRFKDVLYDAVHAATISGIDDGAIPLAEFAAVVVELLQTQELPAPKERQGRVWIVEADQVRNLDVPHLFVAGLTEKSFPRGRGDDCLYLERDREEFHRHGLDIRHRTSQSQTEMLLFYGIVTRARKSLTLSYAEVGGNGQALFCSPFVTAVRELFDGDAVRIESAGGLDPVPQRERILTVADWRTVAVDDLLGGNPGLFRAFAGSHAELARNILSGVEANAARFATFGWTEFDGELRRAACRDELGRRFPDDYQFSATQFEHYAYCRFQFFVGSVLRIEPLESPAVATDHRERGILVHDVLAELHRELLASGEDSPDDLAARFRAKVEDRVKERVSETDLAAALREIERRLVSGWGDAYAAQSAAYRNEIGDGWDQPPRATHFELPFGNPPGTDETAAEFGFATFGPPEAATRIRGQIDRIDVGVANQRTVFNVIDYKTGRPPRFALQDVQAGTSLQLALYTLAVMRLGIVGPDARPYQMGYWSPRETGFTPGLKTGRGKPGALDAAVLAELESTLDELLPRLAAGIRSGHFPVDSEDPHCTDRCGYRTICRITQLRPIRERLRKRRETRVESREPDEETRDER